MFRLSLMVLFFSLSSLAEIGSSSEVMKNQINSSTGVAEATNKVIDLLFAKDDQDLAIFGSCWMKIAPSDPAFVPCKTMKLTLKEEKTNQEFMTNTQKNGVFAFKRLDPKKKYQIQTPTHYELRLKQTGPVNPGTEVSLYLIPKK